MNDPTRIKGLGHARARRYRDIAEAIVAEFGADDPIAVRELAMLRLSLDDAQTSVLAGEKKERDSVVRYSNLIARKEQAMRAAKRARPDTTGGETLADILAGIPESRPAEDDDEEAAGAHGEAA